MGRPGDDWPGHCRTQTPARVRLFLDFVTDWFRKQAPPKPQTLQGIKPLSRAKSA
jgi:hypothetical protein